MSQDLMMEPEEDTGIDDLSMPTIEPALEIEPEPVAGMVSAPVAQPLMQVLPADFPLPALIQFVPDATLKAALDEAVAYALSVGITGNDGLQRADLALTAMNDAIKAVETHFEEPAAIAHRLHKQITVLRGDWTKAASDAKHTIGRRMWTERDRIDREAREATRKAQEEENRKAREKAAKEAADAEANKAPAQLVEQLKKEAETAVAPPVAPPVQSAAPLRGTTVTTTWKARIAGTPAEADANPEMQDLTPAQWEKVRGLLQCIVDGTAPRAAIELNWSYLNSRAKADKSTLSISGIEAFADGGVRSKGSRGR